MVGTEVAPHSTTGLSIDKTDLWATPMRVPTLGSCHVAGKGPSCHYRLQVRIGICRLCGGCASQRGPESRASIMGVYRCVRVFAVEVVTALPMQAIA